MIASRLIFKCKREAAPTGACGSLQTVLQRGRALTGAFRFMGYIHGTEKITQIRNQFLFTLTFEPFVSHCAHCVPVPLYKQQQTHRHHCHAGHNAVDGKMVLAVLLGRGQKLIQTDKHHNPCIRYNRSWVCTAEIRVSVGNDG